jgi:5-methylcytosine-specific restriction protein A
VTAALIAQRALELEAIVAGPMSDQQLLDAVRIAGELRRLVDAQGCDLAGRLERGSAPDLDQPVARSQAYRSVPDLVEALAGIDQREARAWCRVGVAVQARVSLLGEVLPDAFPELAEAVRSGALSVGRADLILTTIEAIEPHSTPNERAEVEAFLVEQAAGLSTRQFSQVCRAIPDRFNPDGAEPREDLLRERSGVRVTHTRDGLVRWIVDMHPEAAGFLTAAVDARTAPRREPSFGDPEADLDAPPDQSRPIGQKRLDALVSIARQSLGNDNGRLAGTSVTMTVTVSLETLRSGLGTATIAGVDEPICASTARRLAADAEIIPIVLGGSGEQLDQGRAERLFTEAQRRALALRDRGCIWAGCCAPPAWCEVAHIVPWALGGRTDLDNAALMCAFHHRRFDRDGWQLEKRDGQRWLIPPPWVDPARTPRRAGPLPQMAAV